MESSHWRSCHIPGLEVTPVSKDGSPPIFPPNSDTPSTGWEVRPGAWGIAVCGGRGGGRTWWKKGGSFKCEDGDRSFLQARAASIGPELWAQPCLPPGLTWSLPGNDQDGSFLSPQHLIPFIWPHLFWKGWNCFAVQLKEAEALLLGCFILISSCLNM